MKENSIVVGKAAGIGTWLYAALDWFFSIPADRWVTVLAIIGGLCAIVAYLFDIHKKRLEIRRLENLMERDDE
ncbi:hypothetical protein [Oxalobacter formigenes]|uniref:hypothetical protein n=1 Tax=Oxalobacter formigenes TaxID=847 RepID=UPI000A2A242B|nr:hypothetical protein [Oxalobacter formigenes]ARQ46072.1 hypothetical protein BRW83_1329 [Oxalobacter formigenes]MCZ4063701.1 hypothetical protein [Oxalobacter formigenes]QDX33191.1 hypothetical protein FPZ51_06140 [Oxalobacter formigenes]